MTSNSNLQMTLIRTKGTSVILSIFSHVALFSLGFSTPTFLLTYIGFLYTYFPSSIWMIKYPFLLGASPNPILFLSQIVQVLHEDCSLDDLWVLFNAAHYFLILWTFCTTCYKVSCVHSWCILQIIHFLNGFAKDFIN